METFMYLILGLVIDPTAKTEETRYAAANEVYLVSESVLQSLLSAEGDLYLLTEGEGGDKACIRLTVPTHLGYIRVNGLLEEEDFEAAILATSETPFLGHILDNEKNPPPEPEAEEARGDAQA